MVEVADILKSIEDKIDSSRLETKKWHDDVKSSIENMSKSFKELEKRVDYVEKSVNTHQEEIENIKVDLNYLRQKDIELNMVLKGIPEDNNEDIADLKGIVERLFVNINVSSDGFIETARRIGKKSMDKPRLVQLKLESLDQKKRIMAAKKSRGEISANEIVDGASSDLKVYLDDQLTVQSAYLFKKARLLKNEYGIKYVWVRNGRVFMKKSDKEPSVIIKSENDLEIFKAKNCRKRKNITNTNDEIPPKRIYNTRTGAKQ